MKSAARRVRLPPALPLRSGSGSMSVSVSGTGAGAISTLRSASTTTALGCARADSNSCATHVQTHTHVPTHSSTYAQLGRRGIHAAVRHLAPAQAQTQPVTPGLGLGGGEVNLVPIPDGQKSFKKILIANRGEIACRIVRTARRLGVSTVAVYSEADKDCMHVAMADEAYCIGPAASSESYLNIDKILDVARATGAEAIHPGYGFLSESVVFARRVQEAGLKFIGPPVEAIRAMGSKKESKEIMLAAGVPCVPGYHGAAQDMPTLLSAAREIGLPLLIKPTHGGGGKGMRIVRDLAAFEDEVRSAKSEAIKSFGNDEVLLERYLVRPRHVEVQVFADEAGECVGLWERDCSVQRRHQKIIEEAPAPGLSPELKRDFADKAVAAAKAVRYVGAGTVEFIMDAETDEYFFMEMNTRLQVEHPVTEMVTGIDLVEWQLSIAAGNPLPLTQAQVPCIGHAFEARIYAEKPESNFLPDAGRILHIRAPLDAPHRLETGFQEGDVVSSYYDPMISKLIVHGKDRAEALALLERALGQYQVVGPSTNIEFLKAVLRQERFREGGVETNFIAEHHDALFRVDEVPVDVYVQAAVYLAQREVETAGEQPNAGLWGSAGMAFRRFGGPPASRLYVMDGQEVRVAHENGQMHVSVGDTTVPANGQLVSSTEIVTQTSFARHAASIIPVGNKLHVFTSGRHYQVALTPSHFEASPLDPDVDGGGGGGAAASDAMTSPMPARVLEVRVKEGERVVAGQVCAVLESMKLEINVRAGRDGVVKSVGAAKGEVVDEGRVLVLLEKD